jgi:deazaflavin-dependent oxidoreductase (nitroreductase family)
MSAFAYRESFSMPNDFNQPVIDQFRANNGQVGPPFEGARLILLTTTGARSGAAHTTPLGYLADEGNARLFVIASAGGSPRNPAWYHNVLADPKVTVEDGTFTYQATATVLDGEERDRIFARAVEADPGWAAYEADSGRTLPVVALTQVDTGPSAGQRPGDFLKSVHDAFRRELALIRQEVAASGSGLGAQLRINCLNLCQGLHFHHTMEDKGIFPHLDGAHPELAPVLDRLRDEHLTIKDLLDELQKVLAADGDVLPEVERLTTELEAHLDYEEEHLIPILNGA